MHFCCDCRVFTFDEFVSFIQREHIKVTLICKGVTRVTGVDCVPQGSGYLKIGHFHVTFVLMNTPNRLGVIYQVGCLVQHPALFFRIHPPNIILSASYVDTSNL